MSVDNNHFDNREIQALQQEQPRSDAKGNLIMALLHKKRESKMSILRKATLPTLVSVAAIAGVFFVAQPRVVAATPERVIKAIQDIKNYTINSFAIEGTSRHLQSRTTVTGKDRKTVYFDKDGNETKGATNGAVIMMNDSPMKMGFHITADGNMQEMSKDDIIKMKGNVRVVGDGTTSDSQNVKVEVTKGPDGKEVKHIFVNGKEVDKMPGGDIQIRRTGANDGDKNEVKVEVTQGADGKEVRHYFINGKEVDKLPDDEKALVGRALMENEKHKALVKITKGPDGKEVKHTFINGVDINNVKLPKGQRINSISSDGKHDGMMVINAESMKNGKGGSFSKSMAIVGSKNGEKPMIVQSGQTSADYLVSLLKDTTRWTIERGVNLNGQKLDKFTLKGPISPIELYVDPATALPKVLRFGTPMQEGVTIEDVYEYSVQPQR